MGSVSFQRRVTGQRKGNRRKADVLFLLAHKGFGARSAPSFSVFRKLPRSWQAGETDDPGVAFFLMDAVQLQLHDCAGDGFGGAASADPLVRRDLSKLLFQNIPCMEPPRSSQWSFHSR